MDFFDEGLRGLDRDFVCRAAIRVSKAQAVNREGIFVVGFSFPVVPKGEARIRVQLSAAHTREQLDRALEVFKNAGDAVGAI